MNNRNFRIAECCLNCDHREFKIRNSIICDVDGEETPGRVICDLYTPTTKYRVTGGERRILNVLNKTQNERRTV